jgi:hypothetical protein
MRKHPQIGLQKMRWSLSQMRINVSMNIDTLEKWLFTNDSKINYFNQLKRGKAILWF